MIGPDETIAVVSILYNSEALLPELVASLGPGLAGVRWHLTVADNASSDDSVATMRRLAPDARVVETGRNGGYAAGFNAAVAAADPYTAILLLNPDIRLSEGVVAEMLSVLRRTGAGIVVPRLVHGDGHVIPVLRREPSVPRAFGDALLGARRAGRFPVFGEVVTDPAAYTAETTSDWAAGSAMLMSADCWNACGPWDESFFMYSEETDFALRSRDAGFATRLAPKAEVVHLEGESKQSPGLWALLMVNRLRLYRRRHGLLASAAYWSALVIREASRAALGNRPSRAATAALLSRTRLTERPGPWSLAPRRRSAQTPA